MTSRTQHLAIAVAVTLWGFGMTSPAAFGADVRPEPPRPAVMAPLAVKSLVLDAARAGDRLVAVGDRGHILLSDDNGASWRQVPAPVNAALTAVHFIDSRQGWAVGHDCAILHTTDGGETWSVQFWDPAQERPLFDIVFDDASHGIAVGAYGMFLESTDGGKTWSDRRISEDDYHFNAIIALTDRRRLIAGEFGGLFLSEDRGATWSKLESPYEGSFFDAVGLGADSFIVFGLQGNLFRTDDAGKTWTKLETGTTAGLFGGGKGGNGEVVLVGAQGVILVSSDNGRSFKLTQRSDRVALSDVVATADNRLILLGEQGPLPARP